MLKMTAWFFGLFIFCTSATLAAPIQIENHFSFFGDSNATKRNIILELDQANAKGGGDPSWQQAVLASLASRAYIDNSLLLSRLEPSDYGSDFPWTRVGYKIFLADSKGLSSAYLGYFGFTMHGNSKAKSVISDVSYTADGHDPGYVFSEIPTLKYISEATFKVIGKLATHEPPVITNQGWLSGMGNVQAAFTPGASFWVQDYGMNEPGRWTVDIQNQSIRQSTQVISPNNVGSRAYPMKKTDDGYAAGAGVAFDGVWQIDIKIGSTGQDNFCETFYLAERKNFAPGPENYLDGSGTAQGGLGREIDIMETKWNPNGPQTNLPNHSGEGWSDKFRNELFLRWSDIGGAPMKSFATFGAYIKNNHLWLYAYKEDGSLWYSSDAIQLNSQYKQTNPFVPYIGTWTTAPGRPGHFDTEYKNFIYRPTTSIPEGVNPKNNPSAFYAAVRMQQ